MNRGSRSPHKSAGKAAKPDVSKKTTRSSKSPPQKKSPLTQTTAPLSTTAPKLINSPFPQSTSFSSPSTTSLLPSHNQFQSTSGLKRKTKKIVGVALDQQERGIATVVPHLKAKSNKNAKKPLSSLNSSPTTSPSLSPSTTLLIHQANAFATLPAGAFKHYDTKMQQQLITFSVQIAQMHQMAQNGSKSPPVAKKSTSTTRNRVVTSARKLSSVNTPGSDEKKGENGQNGQNDPKSTQNDQNGAETTQITPKITLPKRVSAEAAFNEAAKPKSKPVEGDSSDLKKDDKKNNDTNSSESAQNPPSSAQLTAPTTSLSTQNRSTVGRALDVEGGDFDEKMTQFEKFCERHPIAGAWLKLCKKLSKFAFIFGAFLGVVAILSTQVSPYPILVQPAKELLQSESAAVLAGALEEMASLGLVDIKLLPSSVLKAMADPSQRMFGKDPNLVIEKPELGFFMQSADIFKDKAVQSHHALPRYHDSFLIEADPLPDFINRAAIRDQYVNMGKGLFDVSQNASNMMKVKLQMLPGILNGYAQLYVEYPQFVHLASGFKQTPLYSIERVIDVMYLRDNQTPNLLHYLTKGMSDDTLTRLTRGSGTVQTDKESLQFGAAVQHHLTNDVTETGRMLGKLDDRFIKSFKLPSEVDASLLADHPFKEELLNIPEEVKSHPDKSLTGPLFQTYYNILSRNHYFNLIAEENAMLNDLRMQLLPIANSFGLKEPATMITGTNTADLTNPDLRAYNTFAQNQITTRLHNSSISDSSHSASSLNQTPLFNQPFHYFKSTGVTVEEAEKVSPMPRQFVDILPTSDRLINLRKVAAQVRDAAPIERFLVQPVNVSKHGDYYIDTSSLAHRTKEDVVNAEWDDFNNLPPRYLPDQHTGLNPMIPGDEIDAMARLLTKLDTTILRNQAEMVRVHQNVIEQNPVFGEKHKALIEKKDDQQRQLQELVETMLKADAEAAKGPTEVEEKKAWYQFW